ncbi:ASCH domain-containing protein [Kiloniella antarctica]|uniref:ASCH domain-containing protein n=1 Tax=Kiloniella antarctica TaxID=1550907 RepID=A0ABW5BJR7_9PROT
MGESPKSTRKKMIEAFWKSCGDHIPMEDWNASFSSWSFGDSAELADKLLALVLSGVKTATCGTLFDYEADNEVPPEEGSYHILTDFAGIPHCLIQITSVTLSPFRDVPMDFALAEGEGSYEEWREAHIKFFNRRAEETSNTFDGDTVLVLEHFKVVYAKIN